MCIKCDSEFDRSLKVNFLIIDKILERSHIQGNFDENFTFIRLFLPIFVLK